MVWPNMHMHSQQTVQQVGSVPTVLGHVSRGNWQFSASCWQGVTQASRSGAVLRPVRVVLLARAEKNLEVLRGMLERLPSSAVLCFVGDGPARQDLAKHFEGLPVYFTVKP